MATSGAYYNTAFTFNHSFVDSADPTLFFTGTLANTDITVYKRTGSTTVSPGTLTTSVPAGSGGVYTITLTATEMSCDEVVLSFAASGMVKEAVSITTEPTPSDILEVQNVAVSNTGDFKADVSSLATASALTTVDTEVGQIKAKTDQLTFTVANQVDANSLTGGSDATAANQSTIINHLTDVKGAGWTSTDNLAEITEDVTGLNGAAMRGTDGANTSPPPTPADIYSEFTSGSNEDAFKADVTGLSTFDPATETVTTDSASRTASQANVSGLATASSVSSIATDVSSILADTSTDGVVISTAQAQALADEVLKRSVTNTQDSADAHSLAAIVLGILESSRSATTWTIKKTDGSTFTSKTLTLDSDADPVVGVD